MSVTVLNICAASASETFFEEQPKKLMSELVGQAKMGTLSSASLTNTLVTYNLVATDEGNKKRRYSSGNVRLF